LLRPDCVTGDKTVRFSKLLPAIILLISTCNLPAAQTPARSESSSAESRLSNTQWRLASFDGGAAPVIEGTTIALKFGAAGARGFSRHTKPEVTAS
jgi:hypothetical protein